MTEKEILEKANLLQEELLCHRHFLHRHPETGFDLEQTYAYVHQQLEKMGYQSQSYGKCGLIAVCGNADKGKTLLLRADMDALPICEETNLPFQSENNNMHACGHDLHTSMLLGAAHLLKEMEDRLMGRVILLFQPSEETFEGAKDMIDSGVLRDTRPDAGLMMHITTGMPLETGSVVICDGGVSAPAADYFEIHIQGKGSHGAMPQLGIDPITVAAHTITALQEIHARELSMSDEAALTIGTIHSGNAYNAIPDTAMLGGTLRCYDEDLRASLKERMAEIVQATASVFRASASLSFTSGCPTLQNDADLSRKVSGYMKELLGPQMAFSKGELLALSGNAKEGKAVGSEDFAYFSHEIPTIMLAIAGGKPQDGYIYPAHHPKVTFDERVLSYGSAVYAYNALRYLEDSI